LTQPPPAGAEVFIEFRVDLNQQFQSAPIEPDGSIFLPSDDGGIILPDAGGVILPDAQ
jgi:hypothetical protein